MYTDSAIPLYSSTEIHTRLLLFNNPILTALDNKPTYEIYCYFTDVTKIDIVYIHR